jgi:hypothetical protein
MLILHILQEYNTSSFPGSFPFPSREKKTLVGAGHVAPRIWEVTNIYFGGGETKALMCVFFCVGEETNIFRNKSIALVDC